MVRTFKWRKSERRYRRSKFQRWLFNMMEETELFPEDVAEIIECHPSTIKMHMIGETNPSRRTLEKYCAAFGCEMRDLI